MKLFGVQYGFHPAPSTESLWTLTSWRNFPGIELFISLYSPFQLGNPQSARHLECCCKPRNPETYLMELGLSIIVVPCGGNTVGTVFLLLAQGTSLIRDSNSWHTIFNTSPSHKIKPFSAFLSRSSIKLRWAAKFFSKQRHLKRRLRRQPKRLAKRSTKKISQGRKCGRLFL